MAAFFITVPHSGEKIAPETPWLEGLEEKVLMCDPDRYVDRLYGPVIEELELTHLVTEWHRYVVDLNRFPEDIDRDSVVGSENPSGTHPKGLHWSVTTKGQRLIAQPMSPETHSLLLDKYYNRFHHGVEKIYQDFAASGATEIYQLDAHSMPSVGEKLHRDPGQRRAEIVISDCEGRSCSSSYKDLVIESYERAGFQVAYNWPYVGGRITERYGQPERGRHAIQVELNRALYMDEDSKQLRPTESQEVSDQISQAVRRIAAELGG